MFVCPCGSLLPRLTKKLLTLNMMLRVVRRGLAYEKDGKAWKISVVEGPLQGVWWPQDKSHHRLRLCSKTRQLHFVAGATSLPHPEKVESSGSTGSSSVGVGVGFGGEDAYFLSKYTLGVADGVGGWKAKGIDPGMYSRELMRNACLLSQQRESGVCKEKEPAEGLAILSPKDILSHAHDTTKEPGSSTACLVQIDGSKVHSINVGDSGFILFRFNPHAIDDQTQRWRLLNASQPKCHYFNCPIQLGYMSRDKPSDGDSDTLNIHIGDLVVLGTDGLFDNLFTKEIISIVGQKLPNINALSDSSSVQNSMTMLSKSLALTAQEAAKRPKYRSPFSKAASLAGYEYIGGKMDDITVIAALIVNH